MTSQPSRPNRFSEDHFLARKSSNLLVERRKKMENGKDGEAEEVHESSEQGAQKEGVVNSPPSTCPGPSTDAIMSPPGSSTGPGEVGVFPA